MMEGMFKGVAVAAIVIGIPICFIILLVIVFA